MHRHSSPKADSEQPTKRCPHCGETKPPSEYYVETFRHDGLSCWCKVCLRDNAKRHQPSKEKRNAAARLKRKSPTRQAYIAAYYQRPEAKAARNQTIRKSMEKYPERTRARVAVMLAVRSGRLPRARTLPCAMANQECNGAVQYHHPSYDEAHWLDVIPVCRHHHAMLHHDQFAASQ